MSQDKLEKFPTQLPNSSDLKLYQNQPNLTQPNSVQPFTSTFSKNIANSLKPIHLKTKLTGIKIVKHQSFNPENTQKNPQNQTQPEINSLNKSEQKPSEQTTEPKPSTAFNEPNLQQNTPHKTTFEPPPFTPIIDEVVDLTGKNSFTPKPTPNPSSFQTAKTQPQRGVPNQPAQKSYPLPKKQGFSVGKFISAFLIITSIGLIALGTYFGYQIISASEGVFVRDDGCRGILCSLPNPLNVFSPTQQVKIAGQDQGRTNFLVIGTDSAAGLSDTIILVSYYYKEGKIVSMNIPRDFYVQDTYGRYKINEVYPTAQRALKQPGAGAKHLAQLLEKEFKIDIHYWAVTNFEGVEQLINELGGIDVDVPNGFTDCNFPTKNYSGFLRPCPVFKEGKQKMSGEVALIYARSRKGNNGEGSDFARSKRQQIVIQAVVEKVVNLSLLDNIGNINTYLTLASKSGQTNFTDIQQIQAMYNIVKQIDLNSAFLRVNWNDSNGFLCPGPEPEIQYYITYCQGQVAGTNSVPSQARQTAIDSVQNLLKYAETGNLYDKEINIIANSSKELTTLSQDFKNEGFKKITTNNKTTALPQASSPNNSLIKERAVIVVKDQQTQELLKKYPIITTTQYKIITDISQEPALAGITLPKTALEANILAIMLPS
jgi:LCP family protein required for cell wall assembly